MRLIDEISAFLKANGIDSSHTEMDGCNTILTNSTTTGRSIAVLPVSIDSQSISEAESSSEALKKSILYLREKTGEYPLIITEDRWRSRPEMMKARLLAHLEIFIQAYARNCEVRRIDKKTAAGFLEMNHSYGDASCRYRYGLYLKRHTGHNASEQRHLGELVAVATFSNARKWIKGEKTIRSYEWTRYASLPQMRISGGMGKLLNAFIEDVKPDDIMTYADLEWSEGKVYEALGFVAEGIKSPVDFVIDTDSWQRRAIYGHRSVLNNSQTLPIVYYQNFGSKKYRLKLTDYQDD